ncbi:MAG: alkaline phosphatase family protein [Planctomycetota bacterium]
MTKARFAVSVAVVLLCGGCAGDGGSDSEGAGDQRLLIVGWDGATYDLIDPLLAQGALPHLASLMDRGRTATLESTKIPISSAAWPTISTGKGPGEHGVYSFFRPVEDSYDARLVSAQDVDAPPLWRVLSNRGHTVHVWGVPVTFPPEPVRGTLVSGMLAPEEASYAHPAELTTKLRSEGYVPDIGVWRQSAAPYDIDRIEAQVSIKEALVCEQLRARDWSFSMIVYKSLDVLCHRPVQNLRRDDVLRLLLRLDKALGAMIEAAGEDTTIMVLSDHGFTEYRRTFNMHRWLVESGYSVTREGAKMDELPKGNLAEFKASERAARLGQLKLTETRAYATEAEGHFGTIRLNRKGREPLGAVADDQVEATLSALEEDLRAIEFSKGTPIVRQVHRGQDLYPGPKSAHVVPDLIVEFEPEWRCVAATFGQTLTYGEPPFPDHALMGIFVIAGEGIKPSTERGHLAQTDIAPMALHLLGEPIPRSFPGEPHADFLSGNRAVSRIDDKDDRSLVPTAEVYSGGMSEVERHRVESQIKSSGYGN